MSGEQKTFVILIGHGSRVPGSGGDMEKVAGRLAADGDIAAVETCYMSRVRPFFPETLGKLVERGARKVVVIPYFLHSGLHLVLDMPEMIKEEAAKYPGVNVIYGKHLGYDDAMVALVKKRVEESESMPDVRDLELEPRESYPLPEGEKEFVAMTKEEAEQYMRAKGGHHHHHH